MVFGTFASDGQVGTPFTLHPWSVGPHWRISHHCEGGWYPLDDDALRSEHDTVVGRLCGSSYVTGGAKFPEPEDPFVYHGGNSTLHRARPQSVQLKQV